MSIDISPSAKKELIEYSADVITVLDEAGVIQYESLSLRRMFGYDPEELIGENVFDYIHPADQQDALDTFHDLIESSTGYTAERIELRFRHKDGSWIWVESRATNEDGSEIGGYVITTRDITERKAYERELKQERDRLEQFASIVSHDLRNPLHVAQGRLELAQEASDSDHLDAIGDAHDRIERIIEDMLWLAREGQNIGATTAVDLHETIANAWAMVCGKGDKTELIVAEGENLGTIEADHDRLSQLLENVFKNAIEHSGTDVSVTVGTLADGFYIEDDGPGIPADHRDEVFEAGYTTNQHGTGFGLHIVKQIVEAHGWEIRVTEGSTGGARFEITDTSSANE